MTSFPMTLSARRRILTCFAIASAIGIVSGQTQARVATTRALLLQYPLYFHTRTIAIVDTPRLTDGVWRLPADKNKAIAVAFRTAPSSDKAVEIRGTFVDVGRFAPTDSRIVSYGLQPIVEAIVGHGGAWPERETLFALVNATAGAVEDTTQASMRGVALFPDKFDGRQVTLRGKFKGRNLLGDLPSWPRQTDADFVLQSADAAIWVTGMKPKGKGFDLDPSARRDVGRWLEISGTMSVAGGLPLLRAKTIMAASPEEEAPLTDDRPVAPVLPPPAINFSVPTDGETGIASSTTVRVQFSRDMKAETFEGRVRVKCDVNGTPVDAPALTTSYKAATLSIEIKFAAPLPRFANITVEFLEGITTPDGTPMAPTKIAFSTGG